MCRDVSQMWNSVTLRESLDPTLLYADVCCMSPDGQHVGVLRRHENGGLTENAGHEIDRPIFEEFARYEIAGHENDGRNV